MFRKHSNCVLFRTLLNDALNRCHRQFCQHNKSTTFASLDTSSPAYQNSHEYFIKLNKNLNDILSQFSQGGGERAIANHTQRNKKWLVSRRLEYLFDSGNYNTIASLAGYKQIYGDIPRAGSVAGIGYISKRLCIVLANDATVKGGTVFPITVKKQLRVQEICKQLKLPLIYLVDSGGAFLPLQSEIFPDANHGGRVFFNEANLSSMGVPQLSIVCGSSTAGGAYVPTMSEEMGMVDGIGQLFLGGPPLVLAATGEVVSAEDLGGAKVHSTISGCSDHLWMSEAEAYETMREICGTLPLQHWSHPNCVQSVDPIFPSHQLTGLVPQIWQQHFNKQEDNAAMRECIYNIIQRIVDASHLLEFKKTYGVGIVTGFGRIHGAMCGLVCSYATHDTKAATKAAHFVQLCDQRGIPLIFLVHTAPSNSAANSATIENDNSTFLTAHSQLLYSVANASVAKLTVVIGDAIGVDYYAMGAPCMNSNFVFAWPNAEFGFESKKLDAFQAAGNIFIDDVINPMSTRDVLHRALTWCFTTTSSHTSSTTSRGNKLLRF